MTAERLSDLAERVMSGDVRALARAASLIESHAESARTLISAVFARTGRAMLVGITGPPGAGKSTLVSGLIKLLRGEQKTVGVIAVDPSSPYSQGAILGDRIRMQEHHADSGVFIRSMATRGRLGGIARSTLDMALLFDAAGRDVVLIETVGVGQDEIEVASLADVTVVVLAPGFGDDVQAIKAGIMEIADVFAVNKADQSGAGALEQEIRMMQSLAELPQRREAAPIRKIISTQDVGLAELLATIRERFEKRTGISLRTALWATRLREMLQDDLMRELPEADLNEAAERVAGKVEDPYSAVARLRSALLVGLSE